jgi:DNA transformation protein
MSVSPNFRDYVLEQLSGLGSLRSRRMFGGIGLYCDELFFGLIDDDILYLKVDDTNRDDYVARGCEPFRPVADDPNAVSMSYYRVPEDVLEDEEITRIWGRKAVSVAGSAAAARAFRKRGRRPAARAKTAASAKRKRALKVLRKQT